MHLPTGLMKIPAAVTERLPGNIPLTRDLLTMLETGDNVVSNDLAVRTFGLPLVPLDEQIRRAAAYRGRAGDRHAARACASTSSRISGTTGGWSSGSWSWTNSVRMAG